MIEQHPIDVMILDCLGSFGLGSTKKPYAREATSVAHLNNFPLNFFVKIHRRCLSTFSRPWCKKVKNDQKLKSRGSCP